jgi:hypothetical protein
MSAHKSMGKERSDSIPEKIAIETSPQSDSHGNPPLLSTYDRNELIARQNYLTQIERHRLLEIAAQERKAYADSLVDQFELTGSNLPADANPRQLHLF